MCLDYFGLGSQHANAAHTPVCPLSLWQGGSSSAEIQSEPDRLQGAKEHELVRALVSTLPADYCTVIAPDEQLTHAEMLHELRESGRGEDSASARWSLADHHVQARFHVVHRNRWAAPEARARVGVPHAQAAARLPPPRVTHQPAW